eukprot:gene16027-17646_t
MSNRVASSLSRNSPSGVYNIIHNLYGAFIKFIDAYIRTFIYLKRSRKSEDAQVDVLSALHLNNNNKEVISLFTRLFPGNATSEALNSEFGEVVGAALTSVISNIDQNETDASKARPFSPKQVLPCIKPSDVSNKGESLASCMDEKEFAINIIQGKRKVNDLVESVMHARQSLEYNGPQLEADRNPFINTMPSWVKKKSDKNDNKVANSSSSPKTRAQNVLIKQNNY